MNNFTIIWRSAIWALYETGFATLPVFVWGIILWSTNPQLIDLTKLPAISFLSLSLWSNSLMEGVRLFTNTAVLKEKMNREFCIIVGLFGVVCSTVVLVLSVLDSQGKVEHIWSFHSFCVSLLFWVGIAFLWLVKTIKIQRQEFNRVV